MDNVRYNISPCTKAEVDAFIGGLDTKIFVPNGCVKSTERSHYDRYSYLCEEQRVAIVYDITAKIVSITARQDYARQLLDQFDPQNKSVKRSTVPAQNSSRTQQQSTHAQPLPDIPPAHGGDAGTEASKQRAKLFIPPERIKRRGEFVPVPTVLATSRGVIVTTDEIYPPQTVKRRSAEEKHELQNDRRTAVRKRPLPSYGEKQIKPLATRSQTEQADNDKENCGISISVGGRPSTDGIPRRAVISFGSDEDGKANKISSATDIKITTRNSQQDKPQANEQPQKRKRGRPKKNDVTVGGVDPVQTSNTVAANNTQSQQQQLPSSDTEQPQKRKRGRPKKSDVAARAEAAVRAEKTLEYKNGYSVKNYPPDALGGAVRRLRDYGKTVISDGVEFAGTPQEIKAYTVTDASGQKVILRYATKRMTLQLQGKRSELFGEVMSQVSHDSDYSSALENYVEKADDANNTPNRARNKVSDVQNKLKKRLPTAYGYLSEQSRIDFSYGIHDFAQKDLHLSDYSVLLVPAFRGLERFVFDLQNAENINVKMIGQAFDKDDSGRYVLKSGYLRRIDSVIYPEVLVALYSEYFAQRNFFAHSDNTGGNASRSLPERADAQRIFEHLLDVVEYNAKKLKEIGFSIHK